MILLGFRLPDFAPAYTSTAFSRARRELALNNVAISADELKTSSVVGGSPISYSSSSWKGRPPLGFP